MQHWVYKNAPPGTISVRQISETARRAGRSGLTTLREPIVSSIDFARTIPETEAHTMKDEDELIALTESLPLDMKIGP